MLHRQLCYDATTRRALEKVGRHLGETNDTGSVTLFFLILKPILKQQQIIIICVFIYIFNVFGENFDFNIKLSIDKSNNNFKKREKWEFAIIFSPVCMKEGCNRKQTESCPLIINRDLCDNKVKS